jgi:GDP-L-fucose synthase
MIDRNGSILVTGAGGMIGSRLVSLLRAQGFESILQPASTELSLADQHQVSAYFASRRPRYVVMAAARVGGIFANISDPVGFADVNLRIALNLFSACQEITVEKSVFIGSSCIYPLNQPDLIAEERLMTGPLEPTNEGYALSKIVGLKLAQYYHTQFGLKTVCPMLSNVYGTGDHFDFARAHVLSALVRRFVDARDLGHSEIELWGTGAPRREFLHADDAARAILFFLDNVETPGHINVGAGIDISIKELASMISTQVGFTGSIRWDETRPDGMMRKCMDISKVSSLGYRPSVSLEDGIQRTIGEYETMKHSGQEIK